MSPSSSKPGCQFNSKIFKLKQANERLIDWDSYVFIAMLRIQFKTKTKKPISLTQTFNQNSNQILFALNLHKCMSLSISLT